MKVLFISILLITSVICNSQTISSSQSDQSLSDSFRKYFNYDTLKNFSCEQVPVGIYTLTFKINKNKQIYEYAFSEASYPVLSSLFKSSLESTVKTCYLEQTTKSYLLLVYFNNFFDCNNSSDTTFSSSKNVTKQVSDFLSRQLFLIGKTFNEVIKNEGSYIVLKTISIDNKNDPLKKGFYNDYKKINITDIPKEKLEALEKEIEKKKTEKKKDN